jgi:hypothetical protein
MFELLLDVMDRFLNPRDTNAERAIALLPSKVSNRDTRLHESHRTLRDGSFGVAHLSQALRARLRSYRPSGTFRSKLSLDAVAKCLPASRRVRCGRAKLIVHVRLKAYPNIRMTRSFVLKRVALCQAMIAPSPRDISQQALARPKFQSRCPESPNRFVVNERPFFHRENLTTRTSDPVDPVQPIRTEKGQRDEQNQSIGGHAKRSVHSDIGRQA